MSETAHSTPNQHPAFAAEVLPPDVESLMSPDPVAAARERTFIGQYHELTARLATNPRPTAEELNMGAYVEEIEPQLRNAVAVMRQKGYNTGSSGFWGEGARYQAMFIDTPIDESTKTYLDQNGVAVGAMGVRFTPENPADLAQVTQTWDFIAGVLPDLGVHAAPSQSTGADVFRYATQHERYDDYLQTWLWQRGALNGHMEPLTATMIADGYDFGSDTGAPARAAEQAFHEMEQAAEQERS